MARRLYVIYSGDRSLTEPEREFVSLLRSGLAGVEIEPYEGGLDRAAHPPALRLAALH